MQIFLTTLALLLVLVGLISLGFVIPPRAYRMHPQPSSPGRQAPLRPDLPDGARAHFVETLGETPLTVESAVVWGRGRMRVRGMWVPMRFKAWYRPGEAFRKRVSMTWFQRTLLHSEESYIRGQGRSVLDSHEGSGPFIDQGEALSLWAESIWMPAFLVHDPAVHWEPVDEHTARLVIETGDGADQLLVHFDPQTRRMTHLSGMRYSDEEREDVFVKVPWRVDLLNWKEFLVGDTKILLPFHIDMAMGETGSPHSYWMIDGIAYNVDVSDQLG